MPQELSITFSDGQKQTSNADQDTIPPIRHDDPIYKFDTKIRLGATQASPAEGTFSLSQLSSEPDSFTDSRDPTIPSGASIRPHLKLAVQGRDPRLKTRQLWEGTVTEVHQGGFMALLSDKSNPTNPDERGSFDFDHTEISPDDLVLINPGATFYWVIGSERTLAGQVKNVSMVQFRRVPAWTERRLDRAAEQARRLRESFKEQA